MLDYAGISDVITRALTRGEVGGMTEAEARVMCLRMKEGHTRQGTLAATESQKKGQQADCPFIASRRGSPARASISARQDSFHISISRTVGK